MWTFLKHDWKRRRGLRLFLCLTAFLVGFLSVYSRVNLWMQLGQFADVLYLLSILFFLISIVLGLTYVYFIYRDEFGRRGYLTFTLPLKSGKFVAAKVIHAFAVFLFFCLCYGVGFLLGMQLFSGAMGESPEWQLSVHDAFMNWADNGIWVFLALWAIMILYFFMTWHAAMGGRHGFLVFALLFLLVFVQFNLVLPIDMPQLYIYGTEMKLSMGIPGNWGSGIGMLTSYSCSVGPGVFINLPVLFLYLAEMILAGVATSELLEKKVEW